MLGDVEGYSLDAFRGLGDRLLVGIAAADLGARLLRLVAEERVEEAVERLGSLDVQFRQARLVVDRDGRAVLYRLRDSVGVDELAEDAERSPLERRRTKSPRRTSSPGAYASALSGKHPSSVTIGARIACLSSFYHFLIRMKVVAANPCETLERPRVLPGSPRGLSGEQIHRLLDVVPATPVGLRDRAIILTLVFTGRRRAEVLSMTTGSISVEGEVVFYSYRGKGGKTGKRELPRPAFEAILTWLEYVGKDPATMQPDRPRAF